MADFGDFLAGFSGQLLADRTKAADQQAESQEWERRQRLMKKLQIETQQELNALERKDGNTFQDESGKWVTQILDGAGNPIDVRKATQAEIAATESTLLDRDVKRKDYEFMDEEQRMTREAHRTQQGYMGELTQASRSRRMLEDLALKGTTTGAQGDTMQAIDSWLNSSSGKLAVSAYNEGRLASDNLGRERSGGIPLDKAGGRDEFQYRQALKQEILGTIRAMPPEERPKTESEFRMFMDEFMAERIGRLDRYQPQE